MELTVYIYLAKEELINPNFLSSHFPLLVKWPATALVLHRQAGNRVTSDSNECAFSYCLSQRWFRVKIQRESLTLCICCPYFCISKLDALKDVFEFLK